MLQDFKDYLVVMGAEEHSPNIFLLRDKTIHFSSDHMAVDQWIDEEGGEGTGHYVQVCQMQFAEGAVIEFDRIPFFFHALGVVNITEWLKECAKGESISAKRAIYHLREAVRRIDAMENI